MTLNEDALSLPIRSILVRNDGKLWLGTANGLYRYAADAPRVPDTPRQIRQSRAAAPEETVKRFSIVDGLPSNDVWGLAEARDGAIWMGTLNGVSRFDGTNFVNFTTHDGLPNNVVYRVCADADGVMWFGFSQRNAGLSRFDGKSFVNFTNADGLAHIDVQAIHSGADGALWIGTYGGGVSCYDGKTFVTPELLT